MPGTVYHFMIDGTVILGGAAELFPEGKEDGIVRGTVEGAVALCVIQMDVTALGIIRDDLLCARVGACVCGQWLFVLCGQPLALIDAFSIQDLADRCHVSASHVYHLFKKTLGMTPTQYINEIRIEKAASKIRHSDMKLDEIACITGFSSTSYFREVFKAHTGITPAQYRANLATEKG